MSRIQVFLVLVVMVVPKRMGGHLVCFAIDNFFHCNAQFFQRYNFCPQAAKQGEDSRFPRNSMWPQFLVPYAKGFGNVFQVGLAGIESALFLGQLVIVNQLHL